MFQVKNLTDRVLIGDFPTGLTVTTLSDGLSVDFGKQGQMHTMLKQEKGTGVYQLITSNLPIPTPTSMWKVLYSD